MNQLTIARKLQLMIVNALLALAVIWLTAAYSNRTYDGALKYMEGNTLPSLLSISQIQSLYLRVRLTNALHLISSAEEKMAALEKQNDDIGQQLDTLLNTYEKEFVSDAKDKEFLNTERQILQDYRAVIVKMTALSRAQDKAGAVALAGSEGTPIGNRLEATLKEHEAYSKKLAEDMKQVTHANVRSATIWSVVLSILSMLAITFTGLFLIRGIRASLNSMEATITRIEDLDFTARADARKQDELGRIATMLNRLLNHLQSNLKTIAASANEVASASSRVASTSEQVATASQQQSGAASSMAAVVEQMTVSVNHVGDRAAEANEISEESGRLAAAGTKTIGQTVADIREISDTVQDAANCIQELEALGNQISAVVSVIRDVADQTNLLALNAAIEAARAGEQGRGFAVVADEVRKLAERTAASTQEITGTVTAMQNTASHAVQGMQEAVAKVAIGVSRANDTSESILLIGDGSRKAVGMVEEITNAIREQGSATNSIASQVERIAQMAEESSAASTESASAARELDQLASDMQKIIATYRL